ncbi:MAG: hypothetical protein RSB74_01340 [Kiritimatiellia bacterium]
MLTQAKLDQLYLDFQAQRVQPLRRTFLDVTGNGFESIIHLFPFFIDTRRDHGLGDLVFSALLRGIHSEFEPSPRTVLELSFVGDVLRVETRDTLLWIAFQMPNGEKPAPDATKRYTHCIVLGAEQGSAPWIAVPYGIFLENLQRLLTRVVATADARWWHLFLDWMTAFAQLTGADAMKDLNEAIKFYDRNRERIESLIQFRTELSEESSALAKRLELKLRTAGLPPFDSGLYQGKCLQLTKCVKLGGKIYEVGLDTWVLLEALVLRVEPVIRREMTTGRRPAAEELPELLTKLGLQSLAGDKRINPDNPEGIAYQTLKALYQSALEGCAACQA